MCNSFNKKFLDEAAKALEGENDMSLTDHAHFYGTSYLYSH